jgi:hypothetical protein
MRVRVIKYIVTLVLLAPVFALASDGETLYRHVTLKSGESIPYAVHLPQKFDTDVSYPVLLGPGDVTSDDILALQPVKVQFVVGENDPYWQRSARDAHDKLVAGGVDSVFEVVPNGEHVMTELIGSGFMQKLEKLR